MLDLSQPWIYVSLGILWLCVEGSRRYLNTVALTPSQHEQIEKMEDWIPYWEERSFRFQWSGEPKRFMRILSGIRHGHYRQSQVKKHLKRIDDHLSGLAFDSHLAQAD